MLHGCRNRMKDDLLVHLICNDRFFLYGSYDDE